MITYIVIGENSILLAEFTVLFAKKPFYSRKLLLYSQKSLFYSQTGNSERFFPVQKQRTGHPHPVHLFGPANPCMMN